MFEDTAVADILASDIAALEKRERAAGYAEPEHQDLRSTLHLILADAVQEGLLDSNWITASCTAARRRTTRTAPLTRQPGWESS